MADGSGQLRAPFPWFGGKFRAHAAVEAALGAHLDVYCEPFAGSLAVLLARAPAAHEVVNDADGWLVNFWRAVRAAPLDVAAWAEWPVAELDLSARHAWLLGRKEVLREALAADPEWFDAKAAGWWVWGICAWIGSGWCSGEGPWSVTGDGEDARLVKDAGRGINRQLPHMGGAHESGRGVLRDTAVAAWFEQLAARLARVRIACGDFARVLTRSVLHLRADKSSDVGVLLDPPYPSGAQQDGFYAGDSAHAGEVFQRALDWAVAHQDVPRLRIVMCGYRGMWQPPAGWTERPWANVAGYKRQAGQRQEVLWCSPQCLGTWQHQGDEDF